MTTTKQPVAEQLLAAVTDLLPAIGSRAREAEAERAVHRETIDELAAAGVFKAFQPARYGGLEMDWGIQVDLARKVGAACGSTSWLVTVLSTHAAMVGRLDGAAQDDVWGEDPDVLVATGSARVGGMAKPVPGGYLLDGAWRFCSGVDYSGWVMAAAPVEGVDAPPPAGLRQFLIPADEYEIIDDWHVSGLRGTGSRQIKIEEPVFIPDHRSIGFLEMLGADPPGAGINDGYVYKMEFGPYFGTILLGPVVGIAHGALEQYLDITRVRTGAIRGNKIAEAETVQLRVARSSAETAAAGMMLDRMIDILHQRGAAGQLLTPRERVESMRDRAYITRTCADAVHRLVRQMGAIGLADGNPVQRHFRDITAASAQIGLNWDRNMGMYGKWALGVPTGDRAIDGNEPAPLEDPSDSVA
jgi:3-hydroxy-9,10-secoandrosta-1,3,5(10)-triene-9,17-dione monooxygenase